MCTPIRHCCSVRYPGKQGIPLKVLLAELFLISAQKWVHFLMSFSVLTCYCLWATLLFLCINMKSQRLTDICRFDTQSLRVTVQKHYFVRFQVSCGCSSQLYGWSSGLWVNHLIFTMVQKIINQKLFFLLHSSPALTVTNNFHSLSLWWLCLICIIFLKPFYV